MKAFFLWTTLAGLALASPAPVTTLEERATTFCGQWDSTTSGSYILYNDLWGMSSGTGSQCTTLTSVSGNTISWSTSWSWSGGSSSVKSFANAVYQGGAKQISAISTIPTTWKYTYTGSSLVANVAYDLFTSSTSSGSSEYEIMVWLAALGGAGPISSTGSPIATTTIAGVSWNLYYGLNGSMKVYSFVASSQVTSFSGDLKLFLTYLSSNQGLSTSQYLTSMGAGTEPFTGSNAVLTSTYSASY
ncbi:family 12 glycosyl hydrolase [Xylariaceae sp. FL1272]|nr:family 12 glycosyl hydrolase [Xylariaceae sp. FL1272]